MKTIIIFIGINIFSYGGIGDMIDNANKMIKIEGKILDKIDKMLDDETLLKIPTLKLPTYPIDKTCTQYKNQIQYLKNILKNNQKNNIQNNNAYKNIKKKLEKKLKQLKEENQKLHKLLKIHDIDYKNANIRIEENPKPKKMNMTITDK